MGKPNFIYIGPSVPPLGLKTNMLFRSEELPQHLDEIAKHKPIVKSLYISTRNLAQAKKSITRKGSLEHTATKEVLAIAKQILASRSNIEK